MVEPAEGGQKMNKIVRKLVLGLMFLNTSASAAAELPQTAAWRSLAKKNFLTGFCVGQTLASQQILLQAGQTIDQVTANAIKNAVSACKSKSKSPTPTTAFIQKIPSSH